TSLWTFVDPAPEIFDLQLHFDQRSENEFQLSPSRSDSRGTGRPRGCWHSHWQQAGTTLANIRRNVGRADLRPRRQYHHGLDEVSKLTHISGPVRIHQNLHGLAIDAREWTAVALAQLLDETPNKNRDVGLALPKWRQVDRQHVEPVVQIVPEFTQGYFFL